MRMLGGLLLLLLVAVAFVSAGENAKEQDADAVTRGKALFHDDQGLEYPSCAHCHSLLPEKDEADPKKEPHLGPGATLWGSVARQGWRNMNTYADVGEASDYCAKNWQKRKGGLKAEQRAELVAFLATFAPPSGPLPRREVQKTPKLPQDLDVLSGGDAEKGEKLTARYCAGCHGDGDRALSFDLKPGKKKAELIVRKVRGFDARGKWKPQEGAMSYYTNDRLPDGDLKDILAYLAQ